VCVPAATPPGKLGPPVAALGSRAGGAVAGTVQKGVSRPRGQGQAARLAGRMHGGRRARAGGAPAAGAEGGGALRAWRPAVARPGAPPGARWRSECNFGPGPTLARDRKAVTLKAHRGGPPGPGALGAGSPGWTDRGCRGGRRERKGGAGGSPAAALWPPPPRPARDESGASAAQAAASVGGRPRGNAGAGSSLAGGAG
jgi:hypothetical protein